MEKSHPLIGSLALDQTTRRKTSVRFCYYALLGPFVSIPRVSLTQKLECSITLNTNKSLLLGYITTLDIKSIINSR